MNQLCIIFVDGICLLVFGKRKKPSYFIECAIVEIWVVLLLFFKVLDDRKAICVNDIP